MLRVFVARWRILFVRGILSIAFGFFALVLSQLTSQALILAFGLYALVDGFLAFALAVRMRGQAGFGSLMCEALASFGAGLLTLALSTVPAMALLTIIAAWVVFRGICVIVLSIELHEEVSGAWPLPVAGALSILCGALLKLGPEPGPLTVVWVVALYAVAVGTAMTVLAVHFRRFAAEIPVA
jgi:uncharacterized membrane protein HdeD (DUF308 family)